MKKYLCIVIMVFIMLAIFLLSLQTGDVSHQLSSWIAKLFIQPNENPSTFMIIETSIRKLAHIFLFFTLGIFVNLILKKVLQNLFPKKIWIDVASILICLIYACFDEIHQRFIPGRTASLKDIGIDAIGICLSSVVVNSKVFKKKSNKESKPLKNKYPR